MPFGRGFGFRGGSPPWPYVGRGRGGLPRCGYYGAYAGSPYPTGPVPPAFQGRDWDTPYYGAAPYAPPMSPEEELNFLREEANAVKAQLDEIENRIRELESEEE